MTKDTFGVGGRRTEQEAKFCEIKTSFIKIFFFLVAFPKKLDSSSQKDSLTKFNR
jgi:hypothetical protein